MIIGIVAAMIIPTLISKYQNKVNEIALKKAYSIINNNFAMMQAEYGDYFLQERYPAEYFAKDFSQNLKAQEYGNDYSMSCRYGKNPGGYKTPANSGFNCQDRMGNGYAKVNNFTFLFHTNYSASHDFLLIFVDINGGEKGPNRIGFDTFYFGYRPSTNVLYHSPCTTVEDIKNKPVECRCDFTDSSAYNEGYGCTTVALNDPKYWDYIKKFK